MGIPPKSLTHKTTMRLKGENAFLSAEILQFTEIPHKPKVL